MILNYKYRLYPTKEQESLLNQQFFVANQAWNYALNLSIHKSNRKSQAIFVCGKCGHKDNADCNAAKNILDYEIWLPEQTAMWNARSMKSL